MAANLKDEKMLLNSSCLEETVLVHLLNIIKDSNAAGVKLAGLYMLKEVLSRTFSPILAAFCCKEGLLSTLTNILAKEFDLHDEHNDILLYRLSAEILWTISSQLLEDPEALSDRSLLCCLVEFLDVKTKFYQFSPEFVKILNACQNKLFICKGIQAVEATLAMLEEIKCYTDSVVQSCEILRIFKCDLNLLSFEDNIITTPMSEILIKEGLAWPQCISLQNKCTAASGSAPLKLPLPSATDEIKSSPAVSLLYGNNGEISEMTSIYVLRTIGGNYFWALIGDESCKFLSSISSHLQETLPKLPNIIPKKGDIVVVTVDATYININGIVRARVLDFCNSKVKVFAIDYGFITTVDVCQVFRIDTSPEVNSFPPLAQICCLSGLQAPPADPATVELVLATLVNMTKASVKTGIMLHQTGGIAHLLSLLRCSHHGVLAQVVWLLSNLANRLRRQVDLSIFIKPLLDLLSDLNSIKGLQRKVALGCLSALNNIIIFTQDMRDNFLNCGGQLVVLKLMGLHKHLRPVRHSCAILLNACYPGLMHAVSSKTIKALNVCEPSVKEDLHSWAKPKATGDTQGSEESELSEKEEKLIDQLLRQNSTSDLSSYDGDKEETSFSSQRDSDERKDAEKLTSSPGLKEKILIVDGTSLCGTSKRFFEIDSCLPYRNDITHHLIEGQHFHEVSKQKIAEIVCGMLNSGHGGSIYLGLTKEGHVKGIKGNRDERDKFRLGLDQMMNKTFNPPVLHTQLDVIYTPVRQTFCNGHPVLHIDLFVTEIILKSNKDVVYVTREGKCFYRFGPNTTELTVQEVRQLVVFEEEENYKEELLQLRQELETLQDELT